MYEESYLSANRSGRAWSP